MRWGTNIKRIPESDDKETSSGQGFTKQIDDPRKITEARKYEEEWEVDKETLKENTNSCRLGLKFCADSEEGGEGDDGNEDYCWSDEAEVR